MLLAELDDLIWELWPIHEAGKAPLVTELEAAAQSNHPINPALAMRAADALRAVEDHEERYSRLRRQVHDVLYEYRKRKGVH